MNGGRQRDEDAHEDLRAVIEAADLAREDWLNAKNDNNTKDAIERAQKQYTALALDLTNLAIQAWLDGAL